MVSRKETLFVAYSGKGDPLESEYGTKCRLVKRIKNQNLTSSSDADKQN